ncbi:MAG: LptF/LptG family permease [Prevotella sp.]|nr:LptF/LptG family permease [Prevotella sp.]MBR3111630.1 LptF/LptG family permease [Prevotella sp.]
MRIKKLYIFIIKQFGLLFFGTFFICQFVLMMQFLWRYVDELIGKGLSLEVMAQFFWYMGLMLMPQAFPLAILLSSLIAFGNLGESSELTAIKAAGISLMQTFRPLIVIVLLISCISYYFQDVIGPKANLSFYQLLVSVKHKSPELEIPEGVFYDGLPGSNIYVQKKDLTTGKLYGIMIYRQTGSYEDQAIILADSGMMQTTEEKKHLVLTLYSGEWFENMRSQDLANSANIPYRRETFSTKRIVLNFDSGLNLADMADVAGDARMKPLTKLLHDIDSIKEHNDSVGYSFYTEAKRYGLRLPMVSAEDSVKIMKQLATEKTTFDSIYERQSSADRQSAVKSALASVQSVKLDIEMKADYARSLHRYYHHHQLEAIKKFTLSLSCLIFFFIGAPLGAIIRKGGLGVPVIVSVLVFIIYYIFDNTGFRMAREGQWTVGFGMTISTWALAPIAAFFTYKANKDSVVFNVDLYKNLAMSMLGLRTKRHIFRKEVIIEDPDYRLDAERLAAINGDILRYHEHHKLLHWPNPIKVFFHAGDDQEIEEINERLEETIENLSYTKDKLILTELNHYPIMATHAHTRPFRKKWMNVVTGLLLPVGAFFYFRMLRFRFRLYKDLRTIRQTSERIIPRAIALGGN